MRVALKLAGVMVLAAMSACARNQHAPVFNAHADAGVQSVTAQGIYEEWGCGTCHGAGGAGSPQGPALKNLAAHWRRETLLRYLKDPAAARAGDERLKELAQRYHPIAMPAFDGLDRVALETLVDSLLTP
jgi:cytochrome c553